jgi:cytochrome c oxidase cbb3-type subunit 2
MNYGPLIFLAAFFALASSWFGLVLTPQLQVGQLQQTNTLSGGATYPVARSGLAQQGLQVYRANGCATCHSQQLRQSGTLCDLVLAEAGNNQRDLIAALMALKCGTVATETERRSAALAGSASPPPPIQVWSEAEAKQMLASLPQPVRRGLTFEQADAAAKTLNSIGAKAQVVIIPVGPDLDRGWGRRRTVAEDFLFDNPVMPGRQRIGPDLADVGARLPDPAWHLLHLYAPRFQEKASTMPPYRFLFEKRRLGRTPSPEAMTLPPELAPEPGFEVVPRPEARALAVYLGSLRADAPLFIAPLTAAPAAPAAATRTSAMAAAVSSAAVSANPPVQ